MCQSIRLANSHYTKTCLCNYSNNMYMYEAGSKNRLGYLFSSYDTRD